MRASAFLHPCWSLEMLHLHHCSDEATLPQLASLKPECVLAMSLILSACSTLVLVPPLNLLGYLVDYGCCLQAKAQG